MQAVINDTTAMYTVDDRRMLTTLPAVSTSTDSISMVDGAHYILIGYDTAY
jgi:hypothetical protein